MKGCGQSIGFITIALSFSSGLAFGQIPDDPNGNQNVAVLMSYFGAAPDTINAYVDTAHIEAVMDTVGAWFEEVSSDHSTNPPTPMSNLSFTVFGWRQIPYATEPSDDEDWNDKAALVTAVESGALNVGDLENYHRYVFVYARSTPIGQGGPPENITISDDISGNTLFTDLTIRRCFLYGQERGSAAVGSASSGDFIHELLHTYRLPHARSLSAFDGTLFDEYGHLWDVMGAHRLPPFPFVPTRPFEGETAPHINAAFKAHYGWIDQSKIVTVTNSGSYTIGPLEECLGVSDSVPRALRIPIETNQYYYLEFRRPTGFDDVPGTFQLNGYHGALLTRVNINPDDDGQGLLDTNVGLVDCTPETPMERGWDSALMVGRTYTDDIVGVSITPTAIESDSIHVRVHFHGATNDGVPNIDDINVSIDSSGTNYVATMSASASDADGDSLAFFWNFDVDLYSTIVQPGTAQPGSDGKRLSGDLYENNGSDVPAFADGATVQYEYESDEPRLAWLKVSDFKGGESPFIQVPMWGYAPDTVFVGGGGQEPQTISAGIEQAESGDIVFLRSIGSPYDHEDDSEISFDGKRIKLVGETQSVTIDQAGTGRRAFRFTNREIGRSIVSNLTILGAGSADSLGGGVFLGEVSRPTFNDCIIEACVAYQGGGCFVSPRARATFRRCTFRDNEAQAGGGLFAGGFSVISVGGALVLDECTVVRNRSLGTAPATAVPGGFPAGAPDSLRGDGGGGVYAVWSVASSKDLAMHSNIIAQNTSEKGGGGLFVGAFETREEQFVGNTIVDNRCNGADVGAEGHNLYLEGSILSFDRVNVSEFKSINSVLWDHDPGYNEGLVTAASGDTLAVNLRNCLLTGNWWGTGSQNVLTDDPPGFVDPQPATSSTDGDYSLAPFSSCIDAGAWLAGRTVNDRYGSLRYDDGLVTNTGAGLVEYVDIGAVERTGESGTALNVGANFEKMAVRYAVVGSPATSMSCHGKPLGVGRQSEGPYEEETWTYRAFLDFSTVQVPDNALVERVELSLDLESGFNSGGTQMAIMEMPAQAQSFTGLGACLQMFNSLSGEDEYHVDGGWVADRTVDLGAAAATTLAAQLGGPTEGWFSVGLKLETEDFDDALELEGTQTLTVIYYLP